MDTPIDVDEDNQWKHDSEFVKIIKNMYGTCFISNFSREIDWEWSQISLEKLFPLVVFVDVNGVDHEAKSG